MYRIYLASCLACSVVVFCASTVSAQYSTEVLTDAPVAYYQLNETSGATADNIGSLGDAVDADFVNLGTGTGAGNIGQPGPRLGDLAGGFAIDGFDVSNNGVRFAPAEDDMFPRVEVPWDAVGSNPLALDGSTGLTLEAWIFRDPQTVTSGNDNEGIISRYQDNLASPDGEEGRAYELYYDDDINAFGLAVSNDGNFQSGGTLTATDYDVPLGEWVHVVGTYDLDIGGASATMSIYANGSLVGERSTTVTSLYTGAADFWIGQQFTDANVWTFEGTIDEAAVYDKALSAERILAHYDAATTDIPTSFSWNVDASGDWGDSLNWSFNTIPDSNEQTAVLGSSISESRVVYTNTNRTVKGLTFATNNQYLLAGAGSITLEANSGNATLLATGTHEIAVDLILESETDVTGGFINLSGVVDMKSNDLNILAGAANFIDSVTSTGGATINNAGTMGAKGAVDIVANLESTGIIDIDIAGTGLNQFDSLSITGNATLAGTLDVQLFNGYEPLEGEMFTVFSATSLTDNGIVLGGPSADMFSMSVVGNTLVLTVDFGLEGDFNGDGIVNIADYTVWRDNLGATDESAINGNGDGANGVDAQDYVVWKTNFGMGSQDPLSTQQVPEPSSLWLLLLAGFATMRRMRPVVVGLAAALICCVLSPLACKAQYSAAVSGDSPVAYYQLDEEGIDGSNFFAANSTSTSGIDASIEDLGNFGVTGPGNIGQIGPRPGDLAGGFVVDGFTSNNRSVHFGPLDNGNLGALSIADDAVVPNPLDVTGSLTLEAWVNRDAQTDGGTNEGIVSKYIGDGGNRSYNLFYDPVPGRVGFVLSETGAFQGNFQVISETDIAIGEWTHLVATYDPTASTMSLYVNGQLNASINEVPAAIFDSEASFYIGQQFNTEPTSTFEGRIDEVAVYDRALAGSEVLDHFQAATGAAVGVYTWNVDGSGNWADLNNWSQSGVPNHNTAAVEFGNAITSPQTVLYEDPTIIKSITFDSAQPYSIAGIQELVLRTDAGNASIGVSQGDHEFQSPLRLDAPTDLAVTAGSITFSGDIDLNSNDLTISGAGTVNFNGRILPTDGGAIVNLGALALGSSTAIGGDLDSTGELLVAASSSSAAEIAGLLSLAGTVSPVFEGDTSLANGESLVLITASDILDNGFVLDPSLAGKFQLSLASGNLILTAVPEPSTIAIAALLPFAIGIACRRRQR